MIYYGLNGGKVMTLKQELAEILNFHGDMCSQYGAWLIDGKTIKTVKERNLRVRKSSAKATDQILEVFKKPVLELLDKSHHIPKDTDFARGYRQGLHDVLDDMERILE